MVLQWGLCRHDPGGVADVGDTSGGTRGRYACTDFLVKVGFLAMSHV